MIAVAGNGAFEQSTPTSQASKADAAAALPKQAGASPLTHGFSLARIKSLHDHEGATVSELVDAQLSQRQVGG